MARMKLACVVAVLALIASTSSARAQSAAAEAEFLRAQKLEKEGKLAEACPAYAKSYELEPLNGALYQLARCYEATGRTASAWIRFRTLAQRDTNETRRKASAARATALEPRLIKLLITVPVPIQGLRVTRDGNDVTAMIGIEDPVDPGHYKIAANAEGYQPFEAEIVVEAEAEGTTITVDIPALEAPVARPPGPGEVGDEIEDDAAPRTGGDPGSGRRIAGYAIGGAGLVALGAGAFFAVKAKGDWSEVETLCPGRICDTEEDVATARDKIASARTAGNVSTALVAGGVVAVAVGTYLWLRAPRRSVEITPHLGDGSAALTITGGF